MGRPSAKIVVPHVQRGPLAQLAEQLTTNKPLYRIISCSSVAEMMQKAAFRRLRRVQIALEVSPLGLEPRTG